MKTILLFLLRCYKLGISPFLGQNCRFYPSCSEYAAEAINVHGAVKGCALAACRLSKCHPWHAGGLDPVPPPPSGISVAPPAAKVDREVNPDRHSCRCSRS